jgi:hypothetical protein
MLRPSPILTACLLSIVFACSSSSSGAPAAAPTGEGGTGAPQRLVQSCALIQAGATRAQGGTFDAGSWGDVPAALQQLPSGAALCGTLVTGSGTALGDQTTYIQTTLWDQGIFDFYAPLVQEVDTGCSLEPMTTDDSPAAATSYTTFSCPSGAFGGITADTAYDFLAITFTPKK